MDIIKEIFGIFKEMSSGIWVIFGSLISLGGVKLTMDSTIKKEHYFNLLDKCETILIGIEKIFVIVNMINTSAKRSGKKVSRIDLSEEDKYLGEYREKSVAYIELFIPGAANEFFELTKLIDNFAVNFTTISTPVNITLTELNRSYNLCCEQRKKLIEAIKLELSKIEP